MEKHKVDILVGKRLQLARHGQGFTQANLAAALGISFQQIQKYETGVNRVSASKLFEAAEFFEKPINWFFEQRDYEAGPETRREAKFLQSYRGLNPDIQAAVGSLLDALAA